MNNLEDEQKLWNIISEIKLMCRPPIVYEVGYHRDSNGWNTIAIYYDMKKAVSECEELQKRHSQDIVTYEIRKLEILE